MKNLLIALIGAWSILFATVSSADEAGLDVARTAYMEAQNLFVDSMGAPEVTVSKHRNFMRYLAKIQNARKILDQAKAGYGDELDQRLKENPRFDDRDYVEHPALKGALADYDAIRQEVGEDTFAEAEAAYADEFR